MRASRLAGAVVGGVILIAALPDPAPAERASGAEADCLALAVYWEAGDEGRPGMEAVASVIFNRQEHPAFPDTVCAVVRQGGETPPCQFAWWCDGRSDRPPADATWRLAQRVARDLLERRPADPTRDALYFHAEGAGSPWHASRPRTVQIGNHVFYR
jgi:N-acetylmuramoyl-L-alanine amidase